MTTSLIYIQKLHSIDPANEIALESKKELTKENLLSVEIGSIKVLTTIDKEGKLKSEELKNILHVLGLDSKVEVVSF